MAEHFTDALLREWWDGCSKETRDECDRLWSAARDTTSCLDILVTLETAWRAGSSEWAGKLLKDCKRLRVLILSKMAEDDDGEWVKAEDDTKLLTAAQEMREVLRENEWSGKSTNGGYSACPECQGLYPCPGEEPPPKWAGSIGHTPDCRWALLIGVKP